MRLPSFILLTAGFLLMIAASSHAWFVGLGNADAARQVIEEGQKKKLIMSENDPGGPPAPPAALTYRRDGNDRVCLSWHDRSSNETGFRVERRLPDSPFALQALLDRNTTFFSEIGMENGTTCFYRICSFNTYGPSAYSAEVPDLTAPAAPADLRAVPDGHGMITLSWSDKARNEDVFTVERSTDNNSFSIIATLPPDTTSFDNEGLSPFTTYFYIVTARNINGPSPDAPAVSRYLRNLRSVRLDNYNNWCGFYPSALDYEDQMSALTNKDSLVMTEFFVQGANLTPQDLKARNPALKTYLLYDLNCKSRWESDAWLAQGTASSANAAALTDTTASWADNQWQYRYVWIVSGTGQGQVKRIGSNTATTLILDNGYAFSPAPAADSYYAIINRLQPNDPGSLQTPMLWSKLNDPHNVRQGKYLGDIAGTAADDWWLRDGNNRICREQGSAVGGNTWYMDVGKPGFKEAYLSLLLSRLAGKGFDGVVFDYWWPGISWLLAGQPRPRNYPTEADWFTKAWQPFIQYVMDGLHAYGYRVIGNCAGELYYTDGYQNWQRDQVDGTVYEQWVVGWGGEWLEGSAIERRITAFRDDPMETWTADFGLRGDNYNFNLSTSVESAPPAQPGTLGQTFPMSHNNLTMVDVLVKRTGSLTNYSLQFTLYPVSASDEISGPAIATLVKDAAFVGTIGSRSCVTLDFGKLSVTAGSKYALVMEQTGGDAGNFVSWYRLPNADSRGLAIEYAGGTWIADVNYDQVIIVHSQEYQQKADLGLAMYYIALPDDAALRKKRFYHHYRDSYVFWEPLWDFYIGDPAEPYVKAAGQYFWSRKFTRGLVLFNYETSATVDFPLDREYRDVNGTAYSGTVSVPPRTGIILQATP